MIIDTETKRKLREMNATDLLDAFERLDEQTTMPLSHAEVIRLAVDSAHSASHGRQNPTPGQTRGTALSPGGPADHRPDGGARARPERDRRPRRRKLPSGQRLNVVFQGATGSGKSHLLCALAKSACRGRYRAIYVRMPDLAEQVTAAAGKPGGVPKLVRKYSTYNLLAIDEWLVDKPDEPFKTIPARAHGTPVRHGQHRVRHPTGDQGMAPPAWRRHQSPTRSSTASCTTRSGSIPANTT